MTTVSEVSPSLQATMNGSTTAKTTTQAAQDQFMTLLVTQMKNQDPLNPMDNAQVTSQLAQLQTVTGINKLNTSLSTMMGSAQTTQSLGMIGKGVLVDGNSLNLVNGQGPLGFNMANSAADVSLTIRNAAGAVVRTVDLGAQKAGSLPYMWDGKNDAGVVQADGAYSFTVNAMSTNGAAVDGATPLTFDTIASVTTGTTGATLNLAHNGTKSLNDIRQVL
jgi:flagellar basal-body rod modification protein FlgD